jgi:hypothetical protein
MFALNVGFDLRIICLHHLHINHSDAVTAQAVAVSGIDNDIKLLMPTVDTDISFVVVD